MPGPVFVLRPVRLLTLARSGFCPAPGQAFDPCPVRFLLFVRSGFILHAVRLLPSLIFDAPGGKIRKTTDFCRQPDSLSKLPQKIYVIVVR
ncbi:hypothetical protein BRYFOR_05233 [Marvinbryantia formatexigens DSM 14469]|uniref:Uncharacterized protein n=1 Tax=Marvinbryantia formatexigens DSM 14469 TaxID=478749 RepID=C6L9E3_9FIRM|nr:hypothetical protein BRYFOR_05233 [Marvinbryantia formatexigens DSM 14469]